MTQDRFFAASVSMVNHGPLIDHTSGAPFRTGDVMVIGGLTCGAGTCTPTATVEAYDRELRAFSARPSLSVPRWGHTAVRLRDASLLVVGGSSSYALTPAGLLEATPLERWYVSTSPFQAIEYLGLDETQEHLRYTWRPQPRLAEGRFLPAVAPIYDGRVLVLGGLGAAGPLSSVEIYDTHHRTVNAAAWSLIHPRGYHTVSPLPSGGLLVVGGMTSGSSVTATAEMIDTIPDPAVVVEVEPMPFATAGHAAVTFGPVGQERVLVTGGADLAGNVSGRAAIFDPRTGTWTDLGSPITPRAWHKMVLIPGAVLVIGGQNQSGVVADVDGFNIATETFDLWSELATGRYGVIAATLRGHEVLVAGGVGAPGVLSSSEIGGACGADMCRGPIPACACPECPDRDGDGLNDAWEEAGGIDLDYDGVLDTLLPGADPDVRDLYVEIDYMRGTSDGGPPQARASYRPSPIAIARLEATFLARGIRPHIEVDDIVPWWSLTDIGDAWFTNPALGNPFTDLHLDDVKALYFEPGRRLTHRYLLVVHEMACAGGLASGCGEVPGDDVTLRDAAMDNAHDLGASLMLHELGHTFGFMHGGLGVYSPTPFSSYAEGAPNYSSAMNGRGGYRTWVAGTPLSDPSYGVPGDLSAVDLPTLSESALDERVGVVGLTPPYVTYLACPAGVTAPPRTDCTSPACLPFLTRTTSVVLDSAPTEVKQVYFWRILVTGPNNRVDWNCDQKYDANLIAANVNGDFDKVRNADGSYKRVVIGGTTHIRVAPLLSPMEGFDDWSNLQLPFQCTEAANPPDDVVVTPTPW